MDLHISLIVSKWDHPTLAEPDPDEPEEEGDFLAIRLSKEVSVVGEASEINRWAQEILLLTGMRG